MGQLLIYRIPSNNIRGYYEIFPFFGEEITRGRTLLEVLDIFLAVSFTSRRNL